jgi:putative transposase
VPGSRLRLVSISRYPPLAQTWHRKPETCATPDPAGQAAWTLGCLYDYLSIFLFEVYDTIQHPALGQSPRDAYLKGLQNAGFRSNRVIAYDQEFLMATLPTTSRGSAKVSPGRGVMLHRIYYWAEAFRDPAVENRDVAIRYDPFDIGTAYAS